MRYKNFEIQIEPTRPLRVNRDGLSVHCDGFQITILDREITVDAFVAAVGYEILENDVHEAEQFAKDYVDSEKMGLRNHDENPS